MLNFRKINTSLLALSTSLFFNQQVFSMRPLPGVSESELTTYGENYKGFSVALIEKDKISSWDNPESRFCGGAYIDHGLIDKSIQVILTAKHCIENHATPSTDFYVHGPKAKAWVHSYLMSDTQDIGAVFTWSYKWSNQPGAPVSFFKFDAEKNQQNYIATGFHNVRQGITTPRASPIAAKPDPLGRPRYMTNEFCSQPKTALGTPYEGDSGSPLFNERNEVVGVISAGPIYYQYSTTGPFIWEALTEEFMDKIKAKVLELSKS